MRTIQKSVEPGSLLRHRLAPHADYDNYQDKDSLRQNLAKEQRGLCCYCMSRIRSSADAMKVEHWRSQAQFPSEQLDYSNLLGACLGAEGQPIHFQHCDTRKGQQPLSKNPSNPSHRIEEFIRYSGDGRIFSDDAVFDAELNQVLNLNTAFLRTNRKRMLAAFLRGICKPGQEFTRNLLQQRLGEWNGETHSGQLHPFCQVIAYWLRERLRRA